MATSGLRKPRGTLIATLLLFGAWTSTATAALPYDYPEEQVVHYEYEYTGGRAYELGITPNGALAFGRYDGGARYACLTGRQRERLAALRRRLHGLPRNTESGTWLGTSVQELSVGGWEATRYHTAYATETARPPTAVRRLIEHIHRLVSKYRSAADPVPDALGPYSPLCVASEAGRRRQPAIVEGHGIRAVEVDMTAREVRQRLGPPDSIDRDPPRSSRFDPPLVAYRYERERMEVAFRESSSSARTVWRVRTRNRRHRTRRGLSVGSTEAAVLRLARAEPCEVDGGSGRCVIEGDGPALMSFRLLDGSVREVSVSLAIRPF